ncbi:MAG: hypothetical protein V7641_3751 [Blastocatellia bacterium]
MRLLVVKLCLVNSYCATDLVKPLLKGPQKQAGKDGPASTGDQIEQVIKERATALAKELARSAVPLWLFVPGNNDLIDERLETLPYYHRFMNVLMNSSELVGRVRVKDLCPEAESDYVAHVEGPYSFVGFNNASFKNNNEGARLNDDEYKNRQPAAAGDWSPKQISDEQARLLARVKNLVETSSPYVYIFYHIPEVDDPHLVSGSPEAALLSVMNTRSRNSSMVGTSYLYSSWFVPASIRQSWDELIHLDKVKGLFAGHLHDSRREAYQSFRWMRGFDYSSDTFTKLYICPPLAVKRQEGKEPQARGFQEISLDESGSIGDAQGSNGVHIVWYEAACDNCKVVKKFTDDAPATSGLARQLSLGQLLEAHGRPQDAEAIYAKVLAGQPGSADGIASESLQRVKEQRRQYTMSPGISAWLAVIGALCFGIVIGWITHRTLRRSRPSGLSDIATVIGAIGGAAVTGLFRRDSGDFGAYCIGLLIGFFAYLIIAVKTTPRKKRQAIGDWLGTEPASGSPGSGGQDNAAPPPDQHTDDADFPVPE